MKMIPGADEGLFGPEDGSEGVPPLEAVRATNQFIRECRENLSEELLVDSCILYSAIP